MFLIFWKLRNSCFQGTPLGGCFNIYFDFADMFFFKTSATSQGATNFRYFWIYSSLQTLSLQRQFFFLKGNFAKLCIRKFSTISQLKHWSHEFLLSVKSLLTKSSFKIFTNLIGYQYKSRPPGGLLLGQCSVSIQRTYGGAPTQRYDFNKVAFAALWGVLLWFLFPICGALFWGLPLGDCFYLNIFL